MATVYLRKGAPYSPELHVVKVFDAVPAASGNHIVDLPPGRYNITVCVESSITGTTTTFSLFLPLLDAEQTIVPGALPGYWFNLIGPQQSTVATDTITLSAGANGSVYFHLVNSEMSGAAIIDILLLHGLRFTFTKGTAVEGEKCIVTVLAMRH